MTDHKALIAEARLYDNTGGLMGAPGSPNAKLCDLIRRLAAALEEATPPDGWRVTTYERDDGVCVEEGQPGRWWVTNNYGTDVRNTHDTARAAMEALEGEG